MMMQSFVKFAWSFFKGLVWALLLLLVLLVVAVSLIGFTAYGNQFAANQIANLASTPDLKISLQGARGLLQGHFRLDSITLADTKGEFAHIDGLKLDWTPTALFRQRFHAAEISAAKVVFSRTPIKTIEQPSKDSTFSLPVEVAVDKIDLPLVTLGQAIVGKDTDIAIAGSAKAVTDQISLDIKANEKTRPEAGATAKLAYGVNARTLTLDARLAEPQGGMLARQLSLPGMPPVEITVRGDGPLDAWQGAISGKVNGNDVLHLTGMHTKSQGDLHELIVNGGGQVSELLPPALRSLFAGETKVDISAEFSEAGLVEIRAGSIANDSLSATASGKLDPNGEAALKVTVSPARDTIDLSLPMTSGTLNAALTGANVTLSGPFRQARLNLDAAIDHFTTPDAGVEAITLKASSPAFNLQTRSGPLLLTLNAGKVNFKSEQAAKLVQGPLKIDAAMDVDPELIKVAKIAIESPKFGGTITGEFKPLTKGLTADLKLFVLPDALLPPDLAAKAEGTIALTGKLAATLPDKADITELKVASNLINTEGTASYDAGALTATLRGALADLSLFQPGSAGKLDFAVDVSGQATAPKIAALVSAPELRAAGQTLTDLDVKFDGIVDPRRPGGKLSAAVTVLGQKLNASADVVAQDGAVSVPAFDVKAGANTLSGAIALDKTFKPSGKIDIDLADIASLAALANQQAEGTLKGSFEVVSIDGKTSGRLNLAGAQLKAQGVEINSPTIDVGIADLASKQVDGVVKATTIASGANRLDDIALKFALAGPQTTFDLSSQFDGAPLTATGAVEQADSAIAVTLQSFAAAPRKIPVKLSAPTTIMVRDGAAVIDNLVIAAGDGTIAVKGSAGKALNIEAKIAALPASLANTFAKDLGAEGALSANVTVKGDSSAPIVAFDANLTGASTVQTRARGLENLDVTAKGQIASNILNADLTTSLKDQPTHATVQVNLAGGKVDIPLIRLTLGETTLTGNVALDATGKPSGKFNFDIPDAAKLAEIAGQKAEGALKGTVDFAEVDNAIKAKVASTGSLRGQPITIDLDAVSENGAVSLPALKVDIGKNTVSGAVNLNAQFMPTGSVTFDLPDLALLAALAGQTAEGSLKGKADITSADARITTNVDATGAIRGQAVAVRIQAIEDKGAISLPQLKVDVGKNTINGAMTLDAAFMPSGKVDFNLPDIALLAAMAGQKAEGAIQGMAEIKSADGKITGTIKASGPQLVTSGTEIVKPVVDLQIADLATGQISGTVTSDRIASGANLLSRLALNFQRNGPETAFDLKSQYDGAPLVAKGAIEQQAAGALSLKLASFSAAPKKIPVKLDAPVDIKIANGDVAFNNVSITAGQGKISVSGSAGKALDIKARITALPASLANTFASGLDAAGTISANVTVSGSSSAPTVAFDTNVQNASIAQIKAAGLKPLAISAKGNLARNVLSIDTTVRNADGLSLTAKGTVGLTGATPLAINVNGQLPFTAAGAQLAEQGIAMKGDARFNLQVGGTAAKPAIGGAINTAGGTLTLIRQNLVIKNLAANVTLSGDQARIVNVSGALDGGGTLSVTGTVGFAPGSGLPANLKINLKNAVYVDGNIVAAKLTGDLAVNGKLQNSPALTGKIRLNRADITIPEKLPGSLSKINVKHKNAPADVKAQSIEIKARTKGATKRDGAGGINLDLTISAPRQIFVRGRGLDTELGGEVKVTGTSNSPNVAGGFKMVRGRLAIIGKRLDFTTGQITFGGGMMPYLNMVASSAAGATTVYVNVNGPANNPTFSFTSSPALPQDEVLAQLIFGRSSTSLSAVQIAQLADAVATLAGGQSSSLFNKLRQGLGVDDLDIGSDENGKTNVTAGKYLNKRTYLELQQGDTSKAIINLDIGKGVKLKGEAGADGSTATGLFYEKEY